jgi:arylsulfatase A-like enzyme
MQRIMIAVGLILVCGASTVARQPNLLVIVADDLGYADLGAYGGTEIPTPHIDSLARNGVRCTNAYVSGPYCSPTRAGLLTGRYQQRFGHEFNPGPPNENNSHVGLSTRELTIADRMRAAGYLTSLIGKWHLGYTDEFHPLNRGFQSFFGFLEGAHPYFPDRQGKRLLMRGHKEVAESTYLTSALAREAVQYVRDHHQEPFFLYLAFNAVHLPLQAPPELVQRFESISNPRRRTYAAMLAAMDEAIGNVLDQLRQSGIEDDTLIVFLSDNGGPAANASNNGPLRGHKATTWEGGIRVPFIVQWKGTLPASKVYDAPLIQLDLLPTALAAAGEEATPDMKLDGVNLLPYLKGETDAVPHRHLYWRFGPQMAIRADNWKLVRGRGENKQLLFDLDRDPGERNDLAEQHPEKVVELRTLWNQWNLELVKPAWNAPQAEPEVP